MVAFDIETDYMKLNLD